jgi:hypothetical protein
MTSVDTEGGRISRLIDDARRCNARQALARAQAAAAPCKGRCAPGASVAGAAPLLPSEYLAGRVAACTPYQSPFACVPESVRIAAAAECTIRAYSDPTNPEQRFSEYRRPFFPTICPPIAPEILNANQPTMQLKRCPLPNKPDNPVLPG